MNMYIQLKWRKNQFITMKDTSGQPLMNLREMIVLISPSHIDRSLLYSDVEEFLSHKPFLFSSQNMSLYFIINPVFETDFIIEEIKSKYTLSINEVKSLHNEITSMKIYIRELIINDIIT